MKLSHRLGLSLLLLAITAPTAAPQCFHLSPTDLEDPFQYTMDLVDSLLYAKLAREKRAEAITISDSTYQADDLLAAEWKFLYKIKLSHEHLKCPAEIIEDYSKSQDEHIQTSAEGPAWVYRALITLESELLKIDTSDDTAPRLSRGVFAEKIADLNLAMDKAWKLLVIPVIMPAFSI